VKARGSGKYAEIAADTLIFAIGDKVDEYLGLPVRGYGFALNSQPHFPMGGNSYELEEGTAEEIFVCGWSRNASAGMVGLARKDGLNAARAILAYLSSKPETSPLELAQIEKALQLAGYNYVTPEALSQLEAAEKQQAESTHQTDYKFDTNEEMLKVMDLRR